MFRSLTRWGVVLCTIVALALGPAAESQAFFGLFSRCGCNSPAYVAQSVCAPQVCNYVPQTCYRTQYVSVPVTTYRPTSTFDACTGCPVTCMRPVTTYVTQARMVPYTTYRLQYSNPCAGATPAATATYYQPAVGVAAAVAPTVGYAPAATYSAPVASGCNTCGRPAAASAVTPSTQAYSVAPAPVYAAPPAGYAAPSVPSPSYTTTPLGNGTLYSHGTTTSPTVGAPTPVPSLNTTPSTTPAPTTVPSTGPIQTFSNGTTTNGTTTNGATTNGATNGSTTNGTTTPNNTTPMPPIPDTNRTTPASPMSGPGLVDPRARTTSMPVYRPGAHSRVTWHVPSQQAEPTASLTSAILPAETSVSSSTVQPATPSDWRASRR